MKQAEQLISAQHLDKEYAAITGLSEFCEASVRLLLGDDSTIIKNKLVCLVNWIISQVYLT